MKTVKTSRNFHGPIISLRAVCQLENRPFPCSIADLTATDGVRHFSGQLSAGDVSCTWKMTIWQNGFWSVSADFHDGGTLAGDFFFAEFLLDKGRALGVKLEGSILDIIDSRSLTLGKQGSDRRIRESWHSFAESGPSVRLRAAPAVGALVATPILALAATPFVVFFAAFAVVGGAIIIGHAARGGTWRPQPCREPSETSAACIEFVPVEPPRDPGSPALNQGPPTP